MRILLAEHNKPWSYKDQDGNILGIDAELLMYLCAQLSKTCQLRLVPLEAWPNLWNTGAADITTPHVGSRAVRQTHSFRPQIWRIARSRTDHQKLRLWAVLAGTKAYDALTLRYGPDRITQVGNVTMAVELMRAGEVNALFADAYQLAQWIHNTDLGRVAELEEVSMHAIADERQTLWLHPESPLEEEKLNAVLVSNEYRRQMTTIFARYIPISPLPKGDKSRN